LDERWFAHGHVYEEGEIYGANEINDTFSPMRFYSEFVTKSIPFEMYNAANDWPLYELIQAADYDGRDELDNLLMELFAAQPIDGSLLKSLDMNTEYTDFQNLPGESR